MTRQVIVQEQLTPCRCWSSYSCAPPLGGIASAAFAVALLWLPPERSARLLPHFVSFATGALLGAALLALLPEALEAAGPSGAARGGRGAAGGPGCLLHHREAGAVVALPRARSTGTITDTSTLTAHASGVLVLVGDSIHNALDGVLIAAAFLKAPPLGLLTTFAVAAHEIPHRVGDFALLVHAGFSQRRALVLNLATGIASVVGALIAYFALRQALGALPYALAFAAAGFLYIAVAGLIPGCSAGPTPVSATQILLIALGSGPSPWPSG